MTGPQVSYLEDSRRLHLHHGPIDLIVDVTGPGRMAALKRAETRFATLLDELVADLEVLRRPVRADRGGLGAVAETMRLASLRHLPDFVTPMAAVAGAVADEVARILAEGPGVASAYVNNGGDVALVLAPGQSLTAAIAGTATGVEIPHASPVRGIATSGWRGRSLSLGIADSVTVLARSAAEADVAATLIANRVDLPGHPGITRLPANARFEDSDLGERPVTVAVARLTGDEIAEALDRGLRHAQDCLNRGLILGAHLTLQGQARTLSAPEVSLPLKEPIHA